MSTRALSEILSPPVKRTLSDEVLERLRQAILSGQLAPGQQLREKVLAESMGVSRGPIREALRRLEREGLVLVQANRRTSVARLSREDVDEIYSLRSIIEGLAVKYVCLRADPVDLDEMQAVVDAMAASIERGINEQQAADLDLQFHDILYRAGKHKRLYHCWTNLRPQIHIFLLSRNVAAPDFREVAVRGHQAILTALKAGDEARALALIEEHLRFGYSRVVASYERTADQADEPIEAVRVEVAR